MPEPFKLSKADAARAMVRHHFAACGDQREVFDRLRSIQFDPIAPAGCNHDLVLQARLPGYRVGDWQKTAYKERYVYDGWDKQACLVPFEGWPVRRIFHTWYRRQNPRIFSEFPHAVEAILRELTERGPLSPKEFEFQEKAERNHSWQSPNLSKQTLRALWHSGIVMTSDRRKGQHVYDLTERIVPTELYAQPELGETEAVSEIVMDRHRAVGILRPGAAQEVWSLQVYTGPRRAAIQEHVSNGDLVSVDLEGVVAHATPAFLAHLDQPSLEPRVIFLAPLDQFMWDREMIRHVFGFDYVWEIYVPEEKRRWGYYMLPVLYGDALVARVEFWARDGALEVRNWFWDKPKPPKGFFPQFKRTSRNFMRYVSAKRVEVAPHIDAKVRDTLTSLTKD